MSLRKRDLAILVKIKRERAKHVTICSFFPSHITVP
jgi:hypothetical protein